MGEKNWTLLELSDFCNDEEKLLNFLKKRNLIPQTKNCPKCGWGMKMHQKLWTCYKTVKSKKGKRTCNTRISINKNTWFANTKLSYRQVLLLTYMLIYKYEQKSIVRELKISKRTVSQWNVFVKQVVVEWLNYSSEKIGGIGMIVEIGESKFGKRKYNRGRILEGQWVFGGICRETKKIFLIPVEDRSCSTFVGLIKEWVLPGSRIISNCWRGISSLEKKGFEHLSVNHLVTFVDEESSAHTNTIESVWRHAKEFLPSYHRSKKHYIYYLANFMFHHCAKNQHLDLFNAILEEISQITFVQEKPIESGSDEEFSEEEEG